MMRRVVESSVRFRGLVVAVVAGLVGLGIAQLPDTPVDTLPEFTPPTVEVQTEALGLSAEEVEELVTVPLEQDLLVGVAFLDEIESTSLPGLSSVVMTFEPGTDILDARQVVSERLTQAVAAAGLPEVAKPPQMLQPVSSTSRAAMVRMTSAGLSEIEMSVLARWVVVPRLLGVDGVANVSIFGFRDRQLQVLVDPEQLAAEGVTLADVIRTAGNALEVSPLSFLEASSPGTGGFIDTVNQRLHVFHEQAISTPDEFALVAMEDRDGAALLRDGELVTLGDVTTIVEDHQPLIGDAHCSNGDCLLLVVEKFPGANAPEVARGIDAALDAMRPGLEGMQLDSGIYRPAAYVEESLVNLGQAMTIGAVLLLLVLGAFLFDWRTGIVAAVAIPVSLIVAVLVLQVTDTTINAMILVGLAAGLVVLIDDAVVDTEAIARGLREAHEQGSDRSRARIITQAALRTRGALLFVMFLVIAAVIPAFLAGGEAGAFLPPVATAYVLAMAASMAVGLAFTPALAMLVLGRAPYARGESPVIVSLRAAYQRSAPRVVASRRAGVATFAVLAVAGVVALPVLGWSFEPALDERDILIRLEAPPGTSLVSMNDSTSAIVDELTGVDGVQDVGAHVGRAITSDQVVNVNAGEVWVSLDHAAPYDETIEEIEALVDRHPEVDADVLTYSEARVDGVLRRTDDEIVVRIYGEDDEIRRTMAEQVRGAIAGIDGIVEPEVQVDLEEPTMEIQVDLALAQEFGTKPGDVRRAAATLLSGITVGNLFEEQKVFDVVVWGAPEIRQTEDDVRDLLIDVAGGGHARLGEVADVRISSNPAAIRHESASKYTDVTAEVAGRDVGDVSADIDAALAAIQFPFEHHPALLGGLADERALRTDLIAVGIAAAGAVFLLLQAAFRSWRLATLTFVAVPAALAGGLLVAFAYDGITLGTAAGLAAVLSLAGRGAVLLVRRFQRLQADGTEFGLDLVMQGTSERLGPIATSTASAAAILLPIVISGGATGMGMVAAMAGVVLGGLVTTLIVLLVVVPAAYLQYGFVREVDVFEDDLLVEISDFEAVKA